MKNIKIILAALAVTFSACSSVGAMNGLPQNDIVKLLNELLATVPRMEIFALNQPLAPGAIEKYIPGRIHDALEAFQCVQGTDTLAEVLDIVVPGWIRDYPGATYSGLKAIAFMHSKILPIVNGLDKVIPMDQDILAYKILADELPRLTTNTARSITNGYILPAPTTEINRVAQTLSTDPSMQPIYELANQTKTCIAGKIELRSCLHGLERDHNALIKIIRANHSKLDAISQKLNTAHPMDSNNMQQPKLTLDETMLVQKFVNLLNRPTNEYKECIQNIPSINTTAYENLSPSKTTEIKNLFIKIIDADLNLRENNYLDSNKEAEQSCLLYAVVNRIPETVERCNTTKAEHAQIMKDCISRQPEITRNCLEKMAAKTKDQITLKRDITHQHDLWQTKPLHTKALENLKSLPTTTKLIYGAAVCASVAIIYFQGISAGNVAQVVILLLVVGLGNGNLG